MAPKIVIPTATPLYQALARAVYAQRVIFFAGLPGVGKSLLLQQAALVAHHAGRCVHLLQWDVTRSSFETPAILARYPEVDGVTHAVLRKAVGLWARQGVQQWHEAHPDPAHLLLGETPLIGNRLIELVQKRDDAAEALLSGPETRFFLPVPSRTVRTVIEAARRQTMTNPQHGKEAADASSNVLQILWQELFQVGQRLALVTQGSGGPVPYDPDIYAGVYRHLLQHRQVERLWIDRVFPKHGSVYDFALPVTEVAATAAEAQAMLAQVIATYTETQLDAAVAAWYVV